MAVTTPRSPSLPAHSGNTRRRKATPTNLASQPPPGTKQINAGPILETAKPGINPDAPLTIPRAIGIAGAMAHATLPAILSWGVTMGLIFGGCCSNVFALETLIKEIPTSGNLITFVQFLVTAAWTWPAHFSASHPPFFLKPRIIPLVRWLPNVILFFTVNFLNNFAFGYNISVPVHIILRSGGSVTTMLVGFIWGTRYTRIQVFSVAMLTVGIIIAAMSDAQFKNQSTQGLPKINPSFITGLAILALAQILSAIMGLYTQITYSIYGSHWHENLFYTHFLSLPLFLPFYRSLLNQFRQFTSSPPLRLSSTYFQSLVSGSKSINTGQTQIWAPISALMPKYSIWVPQQVLTLALNAMTQYSCISGVNLLGARTSALGVSIVLNMRKLTSLLLSIWLFGNELPPGVLSGAVVVFGSAGIWAWEGRRIGKKAGMKR